MLLDLAQPRPDFMNVFLISQHGRLRDPHGFPRCFLGHGKLVFQESVLSIRLLAIETVPVLAIPEHVQFVKGRIARLVGNALGVHGFDEALSGDTGELLLVEVEDVGILSTSAV